MSNETTNGNEFKSKEEAQAAEEFEEKPGKGNETLESLAANPETMTPAQLEMMQIMVEIAQLRKGIEQGNQIMEKAKNEKYREWEKDHAIQFYLNDRARAHLFPLYDRLEKLLLEETNK